MEEEEGCPVTAAAPSIELPHEMWCEISRYFELEALESEVYNDLKDLELKRAEMTNLVESLHYTVWCMRSAINRAKVASNMLESSGDVACQTYEMREAIKNLRAMERDYGDALKGMFNVINMAARE